MLCFLVFLSLSHKVFRAFREYLGGILNLGHQLRRSVVYRFFLFLALAAILLDGAKAFGQFW